MPTKFQVVTNAQGAPEPLVGELVCYRDWACTDKIPEVTQVDFGDFPYRKEGNSASTKNLGFYIKNEANYDATLHLFISTPDVMFTPSGGGALSGKRINKGASVEVLLQTMLVPPGDGSPVNYVITVSGAYIGAPD